MIPPVLPKTSEVATTDQLIEELHRLTISVRGMLDSGVSPVTMRQDLTQNLDASTSLFDVEQRGLCYIIAALIVNLARLLPPSE